MNKRVYDIRYFAIGHSYLLHGQFIGWQTRGKWGMAASEPENDYFHKFQSYIKKEYTCNISSIAINYADYERLCTTEATRETYENSKEYADIKKNLIEMNPNIVSVFVGGGNTIAKDEKSAYLFYDVLFDLIKNTLPEDAIVVCPCKTSNDPANVFPEQNVKAAQKYGFIPVSLDELFVLSGRENPYFAYHDYPEYDEAAAMGAVEFRTHPGNKGHDRIAECMFLAIKDQISTKLVSKDVSFPEKLIIEGGDSITSPEGTLDLSVSVLPENSEVSVVWEVDNKNIAEISDSGKLKAINDGTVCVKARFSYDDSIFCTKTITITNQAPSFSVAFSDDGEKDVVTLPDSLEYVKGVLSMKTFGYNVPQRRGYKFVGWKTDDGKEILESINVDKNLTLVPIWEKACKWDFTKGIDMSMSIGGFNVRYTDEGVVLSSAPGTGLTICTRNLNIKPNEYKKLSALVDVKTSYNNAKFKLALMTENGQKMYYNDICTDGMNLYEFDISSNDSTITGFVLFPDVEEGCMTVSKVYFE